MGHQQDAKGSQEVDILELNQYGDDLSISAAFMSVTVLMLMDEGL